LELGVIAVLKPHLHRIGLVDPLVAAAFYSF
jgi:hypothetical protein